MDLHQSRGGMKSQRPGFHGVTPPAPGPRFPSKPAKSGDGATRAKPQMAKRTESREPPPRGWQLWRRRLGLGSDGDYNRKVLGLCVRVKIDLLDSESENRRKGLL